MRKEFLEDGGSGEGSGESDTIATLLDAARPRDDRLWSIGELARECDVTLRAMRFYEGKGLLSPERNGSARTYDGEDRRRLRLIVRGKRIGLSLIEIRDLLDLLTRPRPGPGRWSRVREALDRQAAVLEEQRAEIDRSLAELHREIAAVEQLDRS
ncbi:MerR family transcriptional regulator [Siculibacillus lacustris]|uniref:MerR family transcriptional regulator n=1 Tax=Siculibacillus lacustris TaxID=1549641 RepID=A0A4Q9VNX5_9HYPH|nr:MerR family transcriptional regulator [Siculibacillus lacustris]TBW37160.1 MerR family transcriptional regulator [Siculibacillus lacustris]